jgi:hypothetical protein
VTHVRKAALAISLLATTTMASAQVSAPSRSMRATLPPAEAQTTAPIARTPEALFAQLPARVVTIPTRGGPLTGDALSRANEQLQATERETLATESVGGRDSARRLNDAAAGAGPASATCAQKYRIGLPKGNVTPGGLISVRGCDLGMARGGLNLLGAFPGGSIKLEIVEWTPALVLAKVPDTVRGVVDQDVQVQVIGAGGVVGNGQPARFFARRETVELPETLIANTYCSGKQYQQCDFVSLLGARWAVGKHWGTDSQSDRDLWRLSIGSAWQLERIESRAFSAEPLPLDTNEPGATMIAIDWRSVTSLSPDIGIFTSVSSTIFQSSYALRFFVTGPAGVAFTTNAD